MKKKIELTLDQARELLGKDPTMDKLIRMNFTEDELAEKVTWEDLERVEGFYVTEFSKIGTASGPTTDQYKSVFVTKNQARSALAMAQLSQLMARVNEGWKPDWTTNDAKYVIGYWSTEVDLGSSPRTPYFLAFPTREIRNQFFEDHRELIEEYFLMYK